MMNADLLMAVWLFGVACGMTMLWGAQYAGRKSAERERAKARHPSALSRLNDPHPYAVMKGSHVRVGTIDVPLPPASPDQPVQGG